MWHGGGWFFGMHLFWWIFWVVLVLVVVGLLKPVARGRPRETPLQVLQRRYAHGELSSEEYEERKTKLQRDGRDA